MADRFLLPNDIHDILSDDEIENIEDKARRAGITCDEFVLTCLYRYLASCYDVGTVVKPPSGLQ